MNTNKKEEFTTKKWSEKTTFEKTMEIISGLALCIWFVFVLLERRGAVKTELGSCISLLVVCVCQAISFWNVKRVFSYVAIIGAICIATALILLEML